MSGYDSDGHPRPYNVYNWSANDYKPVAEFDSEKEAIFWLADHGYQYQSGNDWHGPDGRIYWLAGQQSGTVERMIADRKLEKIEGAYWLKRVESEES